MPRRKRSIVPEKGKRRRPPPHGSGDDRQERLWVMSFYRDVCGIPFERLRRLRRPTYVRSVVKWDDSAALEALLDGQARYFDRYRGRRSEIPPPDPDRYIDRDAPVEIDPELVAALDWERRTPSERDDDDDDGAAAAVADAFAELRFPDLEIN